MARGRCTCGAFVQADCANCGQIRQDGCLRGNGDGRETIHFDRRPVICDCVRCQAARFVRNSITRGQLSPEAAEGARAVVRAIGGEP